MHKLLEEIARILRETAVEIHEGRICAIEAEKKIAGLAIAVQKWAEREQVTVEEKLDFLIFMTSKRTRSSGREVIISGEHMLHEWRLAKEKAKQAQEKKPESFKNLKSLPEEEIN